MPEITAQRYTWLKKQISLHDRHYYLQDDPLITDAQYDGLYRELISIEKEYPHWITPDSPSQKVSGYANQVFSAVEHGSPMLSLNNALSEEELVSFDRAD